MTDISRAFIAQSRTLLTDSYVPRIETAIDGLSVANIWWRANEQSNSIGNLILHLEGNVRQWIISGLGGMTDVRQRQREFDGRDKIPGRELLETLRATVHQADQTLAKVDPATLAELRCIQTYDVRVMGAIYTVIEHFSMHTGQIIVLAKMFKGDLGLYDLSSGNPHPTWNGGMRGH